MGLKQPREGSPAQKSKLKPTNCEECRHFFEVYQKESEVLEDIWCDMSSPFLDAFLEDCDNYLAEGVRRFNAVCLDFKPKEEGDGK